MSTTTRDNAETSVTFSLAELARIEEDRVREEDTRRARAREQDARERREAEARRRAAEEAQAAAEAEARAKRLRAEAEEKVRAEARERAAADVARIEAEARARLEAENAQRAHELALLRVRAESGGRRLVYALAAALGLVVCGGGAAAYATSQHVDAVARDAEHAREARDALAREREHAKATELSALDRRYAALRGRRSARDAEEARAAAEAARSAVDARTLDADRLRAFADALDALEARIETLDRLAALDQRRADLDAWAADHRRADTTPVRLAATRARATGDDAALHAYEGALDQLRTALAQSPGSRPGTGPTQAGSAPLGAPCDPKSGDPGCSIDGHRMF
jgi:colicin import membrane protein